MATETDTCVILECDCDGEFEYIIHGDDDRITEDGQSRLTASGEQRIIE